MSPGRSRRGRLRFIPSQSAVDMVFWSQLGELKLNELKLGEGPVAVRLYQAANQHQGMPGFLNATPSSLGQEAPVPGLAFACAGNAYLYNTVEQVASSDRKALVQQVRRAGEDGPV